jgi:hypothetical protein
VRECTSIGTLEKIRLGHVGTVTSARNQRSVRYGCFAGSPWTRQHHIATADKRHRNAVDV